MPKPRLWRSPRHLTQRFWASSPEQAVRRVLETSFGQRVLRESDVPLPAWTKHCIPHARVPARHTVCPWVWRPHAGDASIGVGPRVSPGTPDTRLHEKRSPAAGGCSPPQLLLAEAG